MQPPKRFEIMKEIGYDWFSLNLFHFDVLQQHPVRGFSFRFGHSFQCHYFKSHKIWRTLQEHGYELSGETVIRKRSTLTVLGSVQYVVSSTCLAYSRSDRMPLGSEPFGEYQRMFPPLMSRCTHPARNMIIKPIVYISKRAQFEKKTAHRSAHRAGRTSNRGSSSAPA